MEKLTKAYIKVATRGGAIDLKTPGMDGSWEDLTGEDFYHADLQGANLSNAILRKAKFVGTNLRYANLSGSKGAGFDEETDLTSANLSDADLSKNWVGGNMQGADLRGADLRGSDLRKAKNLSQADLHGAKYNKSERTDMLATQWPYGFDPVRAGAICVDR